jgi:adenine-specific DNA-methyltransferase
LKSEKLPFDFPKSIELVAHLIKMIKTDDIVLDFFSGSATTAHAIMKLNSEDGGNRKFIMVQLPEETDEKSEAYKAGYKTISEIGKKRIKRAGLKILEENAVKLKERTTPLDVGFRVYKTSESILKEVAKHPNEVTQTNLFKDEDNIKEDATDEDILTTVILDFGEKLDHPIETKTIAGATIFLVDTDALVACFSKNIDMQVVEEIAKMKPLRAVFRDACFKDDKDLINTVESRFKQLAPNTKVHVI